MHSQIMMRDRRDHRAPRWRRNPDRGDRRGSELSTLVVKGHGCVWGGHGLFLAQTLADQWGYVRDEAGTTVWFWLPGPA
jgi:hypothetical protein